jgi:thioredoxin 1
LSEKFLLTQLQKVAEDWAVEAMPTFVFVKEGTILHRIVGAQKEELQRKVEELSSQ